MSTPPRRLVAAERRQEDAAETSLRPQRLSEFIGQQQARSQMQALAAQGKKNPRIVMINGAPTDSNAKPYKDGALNIYKQQGATIVRSYDTPDWSPDKAQQEMEQAITAVGKDGFVGVYAANDGTGGGAIAAMKGNGVDPTKIPSTGQDAELAGIQRILAGEQYMTVYKAIKPEAEQAAELAVALAKGDTPPAAKDKVDNGSKQVPSILLNPVAVTVDNIKDTIIKDNFLSASDICAGKYAADCKKAGIQ